MDCNGLLWIFLNPVNGFEDTCMDFYGMFQKRRPDSQELELKKLSKINGLRHFGGLEVTQKSHIFQTL